jgi:hypothetical protein
MDTDGTPRHTRRYRKRRDALVLRRSRLDYRPNSRCGWRRFPDGDPYAARNAAGSAGRGASSLIKATSVAFGDFVSKKNESYSVKGSLMEDEELRSADPRRFCQAVSPNDAPCYHPATVRCTRCGRWFCNTHAPDEEWHHVHCRLERRAARRRTLINESGGSATGETCTLSCPPQTALVRKTGESPDKITQYRFSKY